MIEKFIVLICLCLCLSLVSIKPEISQALYSLLDKLQSPCRKDFGHVHIRLTIDSGATENMIKALCATKLGLKVSSRTQSVCQADGSSPLKVVGETCTQFQRDRHMLFSMDSWQKTWIQTQSLASPLWNVMTSLFDPLDIRSVWCQTHMSMVPIGHMEADMLFGKLTYFLLPHHILCGLENFPAELSNVSEELTFEPHEGCLQVYLEKSEFPI